MRRYQPMLQPPKTSEYAVKLVDHFVSFIQHLDNSLEGEQKHIPSDDAERSKFASESISLLAVNLTKLLTEKLQQVQSIGGLVLSKQVEGDQLHFEYEATKDTVQCGAL